MKGGSHAQIGFAASVAVAALLPTAAEVMGITVIPAIGIISSVVGGLFPDIDHEHSKYGRRLKQFRAAVTAAGRIITLIGFALLLNFHFGLIKTSAPAAIYRFLLPAGITLMALGFMAGLLKHRGIAHTILFPAVMTAVYYFTGHSHGFGAAPAVICSLILGFNIGYTAHILADSLNGRGVPVLWPLSPSRISFLDIPYGGRFEKAVVLLIYAAAISCVVYRFIGILE